MKNVIIGCIGLIIILFTGIAIQTSMTRSVRQNELDANLGAAMKNSMKIMAVDNTYVIDKNDADEFVGDLIQNVLVNSTSTGTYEVKIYTVDVEKGILDCSVTEHFNQAVGKGAVAARKTLVLDSYTNQTEEYFNVIFKDSDNGTVVKELQIYGGTKLTGQMLPSVPPQKEGRVFQGWYLSEPSGITTVYTADNIHQVNVTQNLVFEAVHLPG